MGGVLNVDQMKNINKGKDEMRKLDEEVEMARVTKKKEYEALVESRKNQEENPYGTKQAASADSDELEMQRDLGQA